MLASGAVAEQSAFHLHLHVVPRHDGDGLDHESWYAARMRRPPRSDLDATAARLRGDASAK